MQKLDDVKADKADLEALKKFMIITLNNNSDEILRSHKDHMQNIDDVKADKADLEALKKFFQQTEQSETKLKKDTQALIDEISKPDNLKRKRQID